MTTAIESAGLTFLCDDPIEEWRAKSLLEKEPGTIAWINQMQPGEVFYDIGANIGVYTLYAAKCGLRVYAFEPHALNALHLARNVAQNNLSKVTVIQAMLGGYGDQLHPFHYRSLRAGSSGSQAIDARDDGGETFLAECRVIMPSVTIDGLFIKPPSHVKIDVDGRELDVLVGMRETLGDENGHLKSLQVETHPSRRADIDEYLYVGGYRLSHRHYTQAGQRKIDMGADPDTVICNSVYVRA